MAKGNSLRGSWIARDGSGYRVRVPTGNGHQYFAFAEHGSSVKALKAARKFHEKMCLQLDADRKYERKHGVKLEHETINIRNRSGITGIGKTITPLLDGAPRISYTAYVSHNGRQVSKSFSTARYSSDRYALEEAILWRQNMMNKYKKTDRGK